MNKESSGVGSGFAISPTRNMVDQLSPYPCPVGRALRPIQ